MPSDLRSYSLGNWVFYTPSWTSSGTQPSVGNGVISGWYTFAIGDILAIQIHLSMGSTTTFGTGDYRFSIPSGFTISTPLSNPTVLWQVGSAVAVDTGTAYRDGVAAFFGTGNSCQIVVDNGSYWTNTVPHTWAASDELTIFGMIQVVE